VHRGLVLGIQPPCQVLCQCVVTEYLGMCSDPLSGSCSFSPPGAATSWPTIGEAVGGGWFRLSGFPLNGNVSRERPGAVKGAPTGAAKRTLYREDRSEIMAEEGKQRDRFRAILKRGTSQTDVRASTIVLSETRGL